METIKKSFRLLKFNISAIILFEIIYRMLSTAIFAPIIYTILNYSVKAAGIKYLSVATAGRYFRASSTYVLIFCILFIIAIDILINISGIIYAMQASNKNVKTNALDLLFQGVSNALRVINPRNIAIISYVIFLIPITNAVVITGTISGFKLPEFFKSYILNNKETFYAIIAVYVILCIVALNRIFSLNFFTLLKTNFGDSMSLSKKMVKANRFKVIGIIIFINLVFLALLFLLEGTIAAATIRVLSKYAFYKKTKFTFDIITKGIFFVLYIIISLISMPILYSFICAFFYELEKEVPYENYKKSIQKKRKARRHKQLVKNRVSFWVIGIGAILLNGLYIYLFSTDRLSIDIIYPTIALVTAHRGDSANAPENTMAAFELANENQADIIEIDVRQTKDGKFVVIHDENLYRTTGVNKKVGEVTYEYIRTLDAGSWFSDEYVGEKIPSLEEVLIFSIENNITLNIELKPATTDFEFAEEFIKLLYEYDLEKKCIVASADYQILKIIKEAAPKIENAYIMTMAFGNFADMEYIDNFSIRHNFISKAMVESIHKEGKNIYAWTLNNEEAIKSAILLNVDIVITDNPYKTKELIYNANNSIISDFLQRIFNTNTIIY